MHDEARETIRYKPSRQASVLCNDFETKAFDDGTHKELSMIGIPKERGRTEPVHNEMGS